MLYEVITEDPQVVELSKRRNITFEVSPTSNYQSGVITQINHHPLMKMLEAGLSCTINTDDPGISRIDLSDVITSYSIHYTKLYEGIQNLLCTQSSSLIFGRVLVSQQ